MTTLAETKTVLRSADAVCLDVDSTVIKEEGIDELAKICGVGDAVAEMTRNAMGGTVPFKKALTERLTIIRPSREQVKKLITDHPPHLTEGIKDLVDHLHQHGVQVFLISGGFRSIVEHVAARISIPLSNVYANKLKFYFNGDYAGFDETQPTAESGGKGRIISLLKEERGFKKAVLIGDGATDLEACPPADAFIGFGGNIVRQQVKEKAKWFVTSFKEITEELEKVSPFTSIPGGPFQILFTIGCRDHLLRSSIKKSAEGVRKEELLITSANAKGSHAEAARSAHSKLISTLNE